MEQEMEQKKMSGSREMKIAFVRNRRRKFREPKVHLPKKDSKLFLSKETGKKLVREKINPVRRYLGIVAREQKQNGKRCTVDILQVSHLRYSYDAKTQTVEVQFVSGKPEIRPAWKPEEGILID